MWVINQQEIENMTLEETKEQRDELVPRVIDEIFQREKIVSFNIPNLKIELLPTKTKQKVVG